MTDDARQMRLRRYPREGVIAGVAEGLGRRLGLDPTLLRIAFVVLTIGSSGLGLVAYLVAWALIPAEGEGAAGAERPRSSSFPFARGPASTSPATPSPYRASRSRRRPGSWRIAIGVGLLALSLLLGFRELGIWWSDALVWPLVLAAFGVALLWGLSRPPTGERVRPAEGDGRGAAAELRREEAERLSRAGFGTALVVGAGLLFLWANGALDPAGGAALAALVVAFALGLILAPVWWRLARNLAAERAARIRSQERTEVAAHLHDSVLQTLALVQKRAADPRAVAQLARRQERELRSWLAGKERPRPDERLGDALRAAAEEVEEAHTAPVEVVVVGDCPLDGRTEAVVAAAREALTNAAKFAADGGAIRLYAEIEDERIKVFVDDRGSGFDPNAVPADRRGLRESIIARMERHGGRAEVRSAPGSGTEIELTLERVAK